MGKDKLRRFAAVKDFSNFFEPTIGEEFELKGRWKEHFGNDNPIVLELGCGKGEYAVGLAKHFPNKNFIGVDIKGSRMYIGAKEALENDIPNVAFCRTKIDFILDSFAENEIDEIWLTFSDPQPKKPRKRLTSPIFVERYRKILKDGGLVHLKTDSDILFEYTTEEIEDKKYKPVVVTWDLYNEMSTDLDEVTKDILHIKTHYEKLFTAKGSIIKYAKFHIH
ncbi:MAG: tRNA (guanosine(46)-N7)-methyltransferase TrmB [Crocinitomicaceae bacterium]|nr:tRNA (guanosine(46)-N7)-methyltransferase TrmB [Crocinitomicaceae bacterium]